MHLAAKQGKEEVVSYLLDMKADSSFTDVDGNIPLDLAAKEQHESVIDLLLKHSVSSKTEDDIRKLFRKEMQPKLVHDDSVKEIIRMMSPLRYDPRINLSCSDCMLFILIVLPGMHGPSQCGQFVQVRDMWW